MPKTRSEIRQFECPCEKKVIVDKRIIFDDAPASANSDKETEIDIFCPHCSRYFMALVSGNMSEDIIIRKGLRIRSAAPTQPSRPQATSPGQPKKDDELSGKAGKASGGPQQEKK